MQALESYEQHSAHTKLFITDIYVTLFCDLVGTMREVVSDGFRAGLERFLTRYFITGLPDTLKHHLISIMAWDGNIVTRPDGGEDIEGGVEALMLALLTIFNTPTTSSETRSSGQINKQHRRRSTKLEGARRREREGAPSPSPHRRGSVEAGPAFHHPSPTLVGNLSYAPVVIQGESLKALIDGGAQVSMMDDSVRRRLQLPITINDGSMRIRMAGGGINSMLGFTSNVPVNILGVTTLVDFFIAPEPSNRILLGVPFLRAVQAKLDFKKDGSVAMTLGKEGNRIVLEVTAALADFC
ncbi:hypothetical protein RQP46_003164 [Phenoliferia psychrophenolica]